MGCNRLLTEIFGTCCLEIQKKVSKHLRRHRTRTTKKKIPKIRWVSIWYAHNSLSPSTLLQKTLGMTILSASGISCPCSNSFESLERSSSPDACRDRRYPWRCKSLRPILRWNGTVQTSGCLVGSQKHRKKLETLETMWRNFIFGAMATRKKHL